MLRTACTFAALVLPLAGQQRFDTSTFEPLFDGSSLNGWVTAGGRYDGSAAWTVEDGAITGREGPDHAGGLLYTAGLYTNFVFACDVRMTYPFDSGVFVRMVPAPGGKGAQVTLDYRDDGEVGAIYSDGFLQHNERGMELLRRDDWNRVEVRCAGKDMHLQAWINGRPVADYRLPPDAEGYAPAGRIGLQVHGGRDDPAGSRVQFKNVRIRELPEFDPRDFACDERGFLVPTEAGLSAGWQPLFNGCDLSGWEPVGSDRGYAVEDGVLAFLVDGDSRYLRTVEDYRDFELRLDFATAKMANSGVFLRGDRAGGNPAFSGCELQILDDFNWEAVTGTVLKPWQYTASLYGSVPAGAKALRELGRWNSLEVRYHGSRLAVRLNGTPLYAVDTEQLTPEEGAPFAQRARRGFIGLQRHAPEQVTGEAYAWFRNLYVRRLP